MTDRVRQLGLEIYLPKQGGMEEFRKRINVLKALEDYMVSRLEFCRPLGSTTKYAYDIVWFSSKLVRTNTAYSIRSSSADKKKVHYYKKVYKPKYTENI